MKKALVVVVFGSAALLACGGDDDKPKNLPEPWTKLQIPDRDKASNISFSKGNPRAVQDDRLEVIYPKRSDYLVLCGQWRLSLEQIAFTYDNRDGAIEGRMIKHQMRGAGATYVLECGYYASQELSTVEIRKGELPAEKKPE